MHPLFAMTEKKHLIASLVYSAGNTLLQHHFSPHSDLRPYTSCRTFFVAAFLLQLFSRQELPPEHLRFRRENSPRLAHTAK